MQVLGKIMKNNSLKKLKNVIILGASSDIGFDTMKIYADKGYNVLAHYNKGTKFFFSYTKKKNIRLLKFNFSTNIKNTEKFLNRKEIKNCDIFINAAASLKEINYNKFKIINLLDAFKINLFPGVILTQILGNLMNKRKKGRIIHLSSIGVKFGGGDDSFCYSLSKHGLEFMPKKLKEWTKNNVLINSVRVGLTNTKIHNNLKNKNLKKRINLIPIKRMATPNEIAKFIYYLGSEKNTYISGQVIPISGGE
jgi:NAD(P)-dependent dehydrogenase (short-subunit alcohol dehydrogenase family)